MVSSGSFTVYSCLTPVCVPVAPSSALMVLQVVNMVSHSLPCPLSPCIHILRRFWCMCSQERDIGRSEGSSSVWPFSCRDEGPRHTVLSGRCRRWQANGCCVQGQAARAEQGSEGWGHFSSVWSRPRRIPGTILCDVFYVLLQFIHWVAVTSQVLTCIATESTWETFMCTWRAYLFDHVHC